MWLSAGGILQSTHGVLAEISLFVHLGLAAISCSPVFALTSKLEVSLPRGVNTKVFAHTERIKQIFFPLHLPRLAVREEQGTLSFFSLLHEIGAFLAHVMCMHVKEGKVKGAVPKELRLLRKAILLTEMSVMSNCLECIRMGRDSRYVSPQSLCFDSPRIWQVKDWTGTASFE